MENGTPRYSEQQLGERKRGRVGNKSKNNYGLYVDQGNFHEAVLFGVSWQECRDKTAELIANGVSELDIHGESDVRTGHGWFQARMHLWCPDQ